MGKYSRDDAYFLLVAHGVVADKFLLSHYFAVHETFEGQEAFVYLFLFSPYIRPMK